MASIRPTKTLADYMVIAISPVLIMVMVHSVCFFLVEVFYRGEAVETVAGSTGLMKEKFPKGKYADVLGLCKAATVADIEGQGWSLNPGRYVGVAERPADDFEFAVRLEELNEELETLNVEARELEERIAENVAALLNQELVTCTDR